MKKILFVCTGNINRSVAAEIMLNSVFHNIAIAKSCAANGKGGNPISPKMANVLKENGFNVLEHRSTSITAEILDWADIIIGFQPSHLKKVAELGHKAINIVDFIPNTKDKKIPDPHFDSSGKTHKVVYGMIASALPGIIDSIDQI